MRIEDVASYFVYLSYQEGEIPLSPLRIQKLLYLAQGWSFRWDHRALFPESFEAWTYGPVNPEVYHRFSLYGNGDIPFREAAIPPMEDYEKATLNAVWNRYREYSTSRLVELTHRQAPWKNAFATTGIISNETIEDYFINTY